MSGRLLSLHKRGQPLQSVSYDGNDLRPQSVADGFGHTLAFSYTTIDGFSRVTAVTDEGGATIQYTYVASGSTYPDQLKSVTYQDGTSHVYGYDIEGEITSLTDEAGVVYATWTYLSPYGVAGSQNAGGVNHYTFNFGNTANSIVYVTDPFNVQRPYTFVTKSGVSLLAGSSSTCGGCLEDHARAYDASSNVSSRTDFDGNQAQYAYDLVRNLETSRTEAFGTPRARTIATTWSATFRQPATITEPNRATAFTYDADGNVLTKTVTDTLVSPTVSRTWTYTYDSYDRLLTADGPRSDVPDVTTYTYYTCSTGLACGQLHTVTDATGHITTYSSYNAHGQPLTISDPNGVVTTLTYDLRQRLTSRQVGGETTAFAYWPTGLLKQVTLPDASYVLYTYDGAHRLTQVSDGLGNKAVYTLDVMGNRTAENTYDPSSSLHRTHTRVINSLNQLYQEVNAAGTAAVTTAFGYDANGNQTSIAAPLARNTANAYDELNRLKQITDPASGVTHFAYDANDNLTSVIDPRNLTTTYTYNGFGDLKTQASPDTGTTTNTYDSAGTWRPPPMPAVRSRRYSYDALNRVTSVAYSLGGMTDQTLAFTYDVGTNGKGNLTGASDANHALSWSYDGLGRVTSKGQTVGGVAHSVGYTYTNGDLTSLTTPSGQTVTYGYNANHQVTSVAVNGTTVLNGASYEPLGPVNGWTWGNGATTTRTYDTDGKITQISSAGVKDLQLRRRLPHHRHHRYQHGCGELDVRV